jgi:hypothetical protein
MTEENETPVTDENADIVEMPKGAFVVSLQRSNGKIRKDRAADIAEIAEMAYKNAVQNLMVGIKRMKREREAMLDLSPTNAMSLMVANDFDSEKFVERDVQLGVDIRNAEIRLDIMQKRYAHLFTEGA